MKILLHNYVSIGNIEKYYESRPLKKFHPYINENAYKELLANCFKHEYHRLMVQLMYMDMLRKCTNSYSNIGRSNEEIVKDEYRKFIDESKYGRIEFGARPLPLPRVRITQSNGNTIKYAPRRFSNGVGK